MIPYFPFWSAGILSLFDIRRDSNASIESYFKNIKQPIFRHEKRVPIPRFISEIEKLLHGWLLHRQYEIRTDRQTNRADLRDRRYKRKSNVPELSTEQWKPKSLRKRKSSVNLHFSISKKINIQSNSLDSDIKENQNNNIQEKVIENNIQENANEHENISSFNNEITANQLDALKLSEEINDVLFYNDLRKQLFSDNLEYPKGFPNLAFEIAKIHLDISSFKSLLPMGWLDGEVINAFFVILETIGRKNNLSVIRFDTYFAIKLMEGNVSIGFSRWIDKFQQGAFNLWLIPVLINNCHWTLLIVCFPLKIMVYFDSLHGNAPPELIVRICRIISMSRESRRSKARGWNDWKVYSPESIPLQDGNCGVYVCIYGYMICSRSGEEFKDYELNRARKGIAHLLCNFKNKIKNDVDGTEQLQIIIEEEHETKESKQEKCILERSRAIPLGFPKIFDFCQNLGALMEAV